MFVEKSPTNGWNQTRLKPETEKYVETLNIDREAFQLRRKRMFMLLPPVPTGPFGGNSNDSPTNQKPRQSSRKYVCPGCGMKVRATKDVNVKCGDCDLQMEKENMEPDKRLPVASNFNSSGENG
jgi:DNA-directed RNA polymerase subunit RPC12/RpoP